MSIFGDDSSPTPAAVWAEMVRGNERFVAGEPSHPRQDVDRRHQVAGGQAPRAALFGCSDSRLAAEIIFDKGLGDLFVVRNAGQVISDSVLGSLEYAVMVLGVPLIVVLGHDQCGAVQAAIDSQAPDAAPLPPHIAHLVDGIMPALQRAAVEGGAVAGAPDEPVVIDVTKVDPAEVGKFHLEDTIAELVESSEMIAEAIAEGRLAVVGANYQLAEGRVVPDVIIGSV